MTTELSSTSTLDPDVPTSGPAVPLPMLNHKEALLAAIPEPQINALLKVLVCACATIYKEESNLELKKVAKENVPGAHRAALALSSEIVPLLVKIIQGDDVDESELVEATRELRQGIRYEIRTDRAIGHNTLDVLKATTAYLINNGEPALKKIRQLAPSLGEPMITKNFVTDVASQSDFVKPLSRIVKKLTGKEGSMLTREQVNQLKEKAPDLHKEYLRLRRGFNQVWVDELRNLVFQAKTPTVPFSDVMKYFKTNKIVSPLPAGFVGRIDANAKIYTVAGKAIAGGLPGPGFGIQMNPEYNPKLDDQFVFTTINDETGKISQYVYSVDYRKNANKEKFEKVKNLDAVIEKVHSKWVTFMRKKDTSPQCVASTALEVLYVFSARIGSVGNSAGGTSTYGISTLEVRHLKFSPGKVLISYKGKDAVQQKHLLEANASAEAKILYQNLKMLCEGKEPGDRVFTYDGVSGRPKLLSGGQINKWFQKLGSPVTVHKLRHVKGTSLFNQLLAANEAKIFGRSKPLTQAEADAMLRALATKVGALLGHVRGVGQTQKATGSTAIANYISPEAMLGYYERLNLRVPRFLLKSAPH